MAKARCGRCGLWSAYPDKHPEKKWAGTCMWYQHRLEESAVFEERDCPDFFERIPGLTAMDHFDYKLKRDDLGHAYSRGRRVLWYSTIALVLSILGFIRAIVTS